VPSTFGYYLYPPAWLGESPTEGGADRVWTTWDPITSADVSNGIAARCFRNGLVTFDLTGWTLGAPGPPDEQVAPEELLNRTRWRSLLMNSHLACLYTAWKRIDGLTGPVRAISPREVIHVQENGGMTVQAPELGELLRVKWTSLSPLPDPPDWRLGRGRVFSLAAVDESFRLLSDVVASNELLQLVDNALRGVAGHTAHEFDSSLIQTWAVVEQLLTTLWERYVEESREREVAGEVRAIISSDRRKALTGRQFTVFIVSEVLALVGKLPVDLYDRIAICRKARNGWIHSLSPVTAGDAAVSMSLAFDLLRHVHHLDLDPAPDLMMVSGV
jgi:hypothetical protein